MQLLFGAALIVLSGFFSGSETAVYRANWIRLTTWADRRLGGAQLALRLLNWREPTVIAALVGTNLCSVFATVFVSEFVASRFGQIYTSLAVVAVVVLTFVFGEYLPKALAQANPNRWLRRSSLPLSVCLGLFAPVVLVLSGIARVFAAPFAGTRARTPLSRQDFLAALRQRERAAAGNGIQTGPPVSSLVARLFRFSGLTLIEAAIPLERVQAVPEDAGYNQVLAVIREHGFSRIPVYRGAKENITGVIFAKDLLGVRSPRVRRISEVSGTRRAIGVLEWMQHRGEHIAVVRNGEGRVAGIVTLEDILEELVGEIRSED